MIISFFFMLSDFGPESLLNDLWVFYNINISSPWHEKQSNIGMEGCDLHENFLLYSLYHHLLHVTRFFSAVKHPLTRDYIGWTRAFLFYDTRRVEDVFHDGYLLDSREKEDSPWVGKLIENIDFQLNVEQELTLSFCTWGRERVTVMVVNLTKCDFNDSACLV